MSGFTRKVWRDYSPPDIEAVELNRLEQGIVDLYEQLGENTQQLVDAIGQVETAVQLALEHLGDFANPDRVTPAMVGVTSFSGSVTTHAADLANPHKVNARQVKIGGGSIDVAARGILTLAQGGHGPANTILFQKLLDELEAFGGGELLFPWPAGTVVPMEGFGYVPSGVTITGNGAVLRKTRLGFDGLDTSRLNRTAAIDENGPYVRGADAVVCVRIQNAPGYSNVRPANVVIDGLVIQGGEGFVNGITAAGDGVTIRNCTVQRIPGATNDGGNSFFDGIYVDDCNDLHVTGTLVEFAGRNNVSIVQGRRITIEDSTFRNCTARKGDGLDYDLSPGCGIELEPDSPNEWLTDVLIRNCDCLDNAGAGIGFDFGPPGAPAVLDGHATRLTIEACTVKRNGRKGFGGVAGSDAGMTGGVYVTGGEASKQGRLTITNSTITDSVRGHGIHAWDGDTQIALVNNDLRHNQDTAKADAGNYVIDTGNLT